MDFTTAFIERVSLFKGLNAQDIWQKIIDKIQFVKGVHELISAIKKRGCKTAVVSGGFTPIVKHVQEELGFDVGIGNDLEIVHQVITGKITSPIIDATRKREILLELAHQWNVPKERVIP